MTSYKFFKIKLQEYVEYQVLTFYYLQNKYPEACIFLPPEGTDSHNITREKFQIIWKCNGKGGGKIIFPTNFIEGLNKCNTTLNCSESNCQKEKRFVIIPMHLLTCERNNGGHANVLIYDTWNGTMERFDPNGREAHGVGWYNIEDFDKQMTDSMKDVGIDYLPPQNRIGPQLLQLKENKFEKGDPSGFCVSWCCLILDLKLKYPDASIYEITENLNNILKGRYSEYIRKYSKVIMRIPLV